MGDPRRRGCLAPLVPALLLLLLQQPCAAQDLIREMRVYNGAGYACLYAPVRAMCGDGCRRYAGSRMHATNQRLLAAAGPLL
jgi:hypothetical protein